MREHAIGRTLTRRRALALVGGTGLVGLWPRLAASQPRPACIVRPEQTEGPYFVDTGLARSDIRADAVSGIVETGVPLQVDFRVSRLDGTGCRSLPDAHVELWQCNARGIYSGVRDPQADTRGRNFLRGYQTTDASGHARFTTIYPGWYPGRAVHLHFAIWVGRAQRREVFTSQLYFDDGVSDRVFTQVPYVERGRQRVRNADDFIFRRGGARLLLAVGETDGRLVGVFDIALQADTRRG